jgi:hypothetical protein
MHHNDYPHKFSDRRSWEERLEWNIKRDRDHFSNQMDEDDRDQYRRRYREDEEDDYRNSYETSEYNRRHSPRGHVSTNWTGRYELEHDGYGTSLNQYPSEQRGRTRYSTRDEDMDDYRHKSQARKNYSEHDWDDEDDSMYGRGRNDHFPFDKRDKQWDDYGQMDEDDYNRLYNKNKPVGNSSMDNSYVEPHSTGRSKTRNRSRSRERDDRDDYHRLYDKNKPVGNSSMDTSTSAQKYSGRSGYYEDTRHEYGQRKPNDYYDERYYDESYRRREPRSRREDSNRSDYVSHLSPTRRRRRRH